MERVLPQDPDAEQAVIGAALLDTRGADLAIQAGIQQRQFYSEKLGRIWGAVSDLRADGLPTDAITVAHRLRTSDHIEEADLVKIILAGAITWTNVEHHARIVTEVATKRDIIKGMHRVAQAGMNGKPPAELVQKAFDELQAVEDASKIRVAHPTVDLAAVYKAKLDNPPAEDEEGIPVPFGFLPPMYPGRVYVLAGYQKDGKTALATQFALHAAREGKTVGFISMEMTEHDLFERMVASYGVPYQDVQTGLVPNFYRDRAEQALVELSGLPIHVVPNPTAKPAVISALCHRHKWDLVVVDHFHRIEWTKREELEANMRHLVNLALKQRVPMLLLCQLSRPENKEKPRKPTMQSLRESGMLEAEASAVWIVYRERDDDGIAGRDTDFIVAASRYSENGTHRLEFDGVFQRFIEKEGKDG